MSGTEQGTGLRIGLTGGIATGKSTFAKVLVASTGARFFCADACVRGLLESDADVAEEIRAAFGAGVMDAQGKPVRGRLREVVFADAGARARLEGILHPRVRAQWMALAADARAGTPFVADIPLLYETGADAHFDRVVVVACSPEIQMRRLLGRPAMNLAIAKKMIASQQPIESKIVRCHHVVWNDGALNALRLQSDLLSRFFFFDVRSGRTPSQSG